jgi:hypothetical protein
VWLGGNSKKNCWLEDPGLAIYRLHFGEQHTTADKKIY